MRRAIVVLVSLSAVFALSGCTAKPSTQAAPPQQQAASATAAGNPDAVHLMTSRLGFPDGFPLEIPVPSGMLANANAQGRSAWDYEMVIPAAPQDVAAWYMKMYTDREWVISKNALSADGTGTLELEKGQGAQSKVVLSADGGQTRAMVTIGIGVPVNSTY